MENSDEIIDYKRNIPAFKEFLYDLLDKTLDINLSLWNESAKFDIKNKIDDYWNRKQIEKKIQILVDMEDNAQSKEPAWRPKTGVADMKPLYIVELRNEQKNLELQLVNKKKVTKDLMNRVSQMSNEIDQVSARFIKMQNDIQSKYKFQ